MTDGKYKYVDMREVVYEDGNLYIPCTIDSLLVYKLIPHSVLKQIYEDLKQECKSKQEIPYYAGVDNQI